MPYCLPHSIAWSIGASAFSSISIQFSFVDHAQYDIGRRAKSKPHSFIHAKSDSTNAL